MVIDAVKTKVLIQHHQGLNGPEGAHCRSPNIEGPQQVCFIYNSTSKSWKAEMTMGSLTCSHTGKWSGVEREISRCLDMEFQERRRQACW